MTNVQKYTMEFTEDVLHEVVQLMVYKVEELYDVVEEEELLPGGDSHKEFMSVNEVIDGVLRMDNLPKHILKHLEEDPGGLYSTGRDVYRHMKYNM